LHGSLDDPGPLPANLRYLATLAGSVSRCCRQVGVNRQQFNRYLAGRSRPSGAVLQRINDHFGLDDDELLLPPSRFKRLFRSTRQPAASAISRELMIRFERLEKGTGTSLRAYAGAWWAYYPSFSQPGWVLKSLLLLEAKHGAGTFRSIERVRTPTGDARRRQHFRYEGLAFFLRERIFLVGHEANTDGEIIEMVLFPSYTRGVQHLHGIIAGCSARPTREPVAAHVVLLRVPGAQIDVRRALRHCGLFAYDDPQVPDMVGSSLQLRPDASNLLRACVGASAA
jgi:transcriptional regulator with XRE-family HTH domain